MTSLYAMTEQMRELASMLESDDEGLVRAIQDTMQGVKGEITSKAEAISSPVPTTYCENIPDGANKPANPSEAPQASSVPKIYCVSGELLNLKNSDWMNTNAIYSVRAMGR